MTTQTPVDKWTQAHLANMLLDPRYLPPPLHLHVSDANGTKLPKAEIVCEIAARSQKRVVKKFYRGIFKDRAKHETVLLEATHKLSSLRKHVLGASGRQDHSTLNAIEITLPWVGLSLDDWEALLGKNTPFLASAIALAALVRSILRSSLAFHKLGFVHGDLLPRNIMVDLKFTNDREQARLDLATTKLIDLEYCLPPLDAIKIDGSTFHEDRKWFKDINGEHLYVQPNNHSLHFFPCEMQKVKASVDIRGWIPSADYHDADTRINRIDWGVDLYCFGLWLKDWLREINFADGDDVPQVVKFLEDLPANLCSFDQLTELDADNKPKPRTEYPHQAWIDQITRLLNSADDDFDMLNFPLALLHEAAHANAATNPKKRAGTTFYSVDPSTFPPAAKPEVAPKPTTNPTPTPIEKGAAHAAKDSLISEPPKKPALTKLAAIVAAAAGLSAAAWWQLSKPPTPLQSVADSGSSPMQPAKKTPAPELPAAKVATANTSSPSGASEAAPAPQPATPLTLSTIPTAEPAPVIPAPAPQPPPPTFAQMLSQRLAQATATLTQADLGTPTWATAFADANRTAKLAELAQADKVSFYNAVQTQYLTATQAMEKSPWWNGTPKAAVAPEPSQTAWLAATKTLAQEGLWVARVYAARATVAQRVGADGVLPNGKTKADSINAARTNLARLATNPQTNIADNLTPAETFALRLQSADLLLRLQEFDVASLGRAGASVTHGTNLQTLLNAINNPPNQLVQRELSYTVACLLPTPNIALAKTILAQAKITPSLSSLSTDAAQTLSTDINNALKSLNQGENLCKKLAPKQSLEAP